MLAVDLQQLRALSRFRTGWRRAGRIQRQVPGQPVRPARLILRHAARPRARELPQLFPGRGALAAQRDEAGPMAEVSALRLRILDRRANARIPAPPLEFTLTPLKRS